MTKHSKNNTASSVFSYAERQKAEYGTKRQRLGNESMRNFNACALCLQRAREPIACDEGHLFCKECVYNDLLTQKKDIKRQKERLDHLKKEAQEEKDRARDAARERVLRDFEKGQLVLSANLPSGPPPSDIDSNHLRSSSKRKLDFDSSTVEALTREAEEAALRQIEREQADALRHKLPDFWLPSLTPTYSSTGLPSSLKDVKVRTTCRGGNPPHAITLKSLVPVNFTLLPAATTSHSSNSTPAENANDKGKIKSDDAGLPICPACKSNLHNNRVMFLMKPCAHVVCKVCVDELVRVAKQCIVCDHSLDEKDIIELKREGTGFAGGGLAEAKKTGVAFQA